MKVSLWNIGQFVELCGTLTMWYSEIVQCDTCEIALARGTNLVGHPVQFYENVNNYF